MTFGAGCAGSSVVTQGAPDSIAFSAVQMNALTASCTITVTGVTNRAAQTNASCAATPAAFTNAAANISGTANLTNGVGNSCLVVTAGTPTVAKTFGASPINDGATTTLVFTLTNSGSNPAQSGISLGDTLPTGLLLNSATPAVSYSAGCSGPANAVYTAGTRVLSGLTGIAMTATTASCTVTVAGVTNAATQTNASCVGNPAAFTNLSANVTTSNATNTSTDQCLVVNRVVPAVAKTFGAVSIADGGTTTLIFTLTNTGTNPAQAGISVGDTLPTGLTINSATPALSYSAGCSGPANAAYNSGTRVLSGVTGLAMASGTVSCTVTVAGVTNAATQTNASCVGNPAAFTNLTASVTTAGATNASTDQCLVVTAGTPTLAKAFTIASIGDGGSTPLVFTLTNSGTNPAQSGIAFTDSLPASLRFTSATPTVTFGAGCAGSSVVTQGTPDTIAFSAVTMGAGTASCTVTVNGVTNRTSQTNPSCAINPVAFTNGAANISGTTNLTNAVTNSCLTVTTPTVAKTFGASPINDGATTTLVFTLTNSGSNPAQSGISLGDTLPTGLLLNSATPAVSYSAGCSGPATAVYTAGTRVLSGLTGIAMTADDGLVHGDGGGAHERGDADEFPAALGNPAAFTNLSANVTTSNATNTSTDQCLVVNRVVPAVAKTFGAVSIADGGDDDAHLHAHEHGDEPGAGGDQRGRHAAHGADDQFSATPALSYSAGCSGPANAAYNGGTRVLSGVTGLAMASGTVSCTVTVAGLTNAASQVNPTCPAAAFTNLTASVTTAGATNASADQCLVVTAGTPTLTKGFAAAAISDTASTTLIFTLTNTGTNPARSGIAFTDSLPANLRFTSATPTVTFGAGCAGSSVVTQGTPDTIALSAVTMSAGTASCTVTVNGVTNRASQTNASCAANPAAFTNAAANISGATNVTNAVAASCLVVNAAQPTLTKAFGAVSIADNGSTTLIFTLANSGSNPAQSGIAFTDALPASLRFTSATPTVTFGAGCAGSSVVTVGSPDSIAFSAVTMNALTASCTITVTGVTNRAAQTNASCAATPAAFTNAAANISGVAGVTNGVTNSCLVVTAGTPTVAKTFGTSPINDGATTTLVFTLTNSGSNPAQSGISLGDTLPTGLLLNSATPAVATARAARDRRMRSTRRARGCSRGSRASR